MLSFRSVAAGHVLLGAALTVWLAPPSYGQGEASTVAFAQVPSGGSRGVPPSVRLLLTAQRWQATAPQPEVAPGEPQRLPAAVLSLPALDVEAFLAEDSSLAAGGPLRTGLVLPADVELGAGNASTDWIPLPDGSRLLLVELVSLGARGLRLRFDPVELPTGGELWVSAALGGGVAAGPRPTPAPGWTAVVDGERALVELLLPPGCQETPVVRIADVLVMARNLGVPSTAGAAASLLGSCHVDVLCHPEWHPLHEATLYIDSIDGSTGLACSATLLASSSGDLTPYVMTARHCVGSESVADTLAARFFRQTVSCGGALGVQQTAAYADLLLTSATYDMTLLLLHGPIPDGAVWAGWTTAGLAAGAPVAGIHHPGGQPKKIALGQKSSLSIGNPSILYSVSWNEGTIEGGSSGSGLYRASDQRFIGVASVSAVPLGCSNPDGPSGYGKLKEWYAVEPALVAALAAGSDDGSEPNDDCTSAVPLPPGLSAGLVVKSLDEDFYTVSLGPNGSLDVTMTSVAAFGDVDLELRDGCSGALLAAAAGGGDVESLAWTNTAGTERQLVLRVFVADDVRAEYALDATIDPGDPGFLFEGPGLAGSFGTPVFGGEGDLSPGGAGFALHLSGAAPFALGYAFVSLTGGAVPLLGGTFYPFPIDLQDVVGLDASGGFTYLGAFDASLPSGTSLVLQLWFLDPGGPQGASASNGLRLVLP